MRVARLGRPTGLKGFLGLYVDPENLPYFEPGSELSVADRTVHVNTIRDGARGPEIQFAEILSRDDADEVRGEEVFASARRPLSDGEYWPSDLVGLTVRPGGGVVVSVELGRAQDRLVVERDGSRFEVPFVDDLVPVVDVESGFVEIAEIEGLSEPSA